MRGQGRGMGFGQGMGRRRRMRRFQPERTVAEPTRDQSSTSAAASVTTRIARVDTAKCIGCGNCARACPFEAVMVRDGTAHVDAAKCRGCRVCTQACPTGAIS